MKKQSRPQTFLQACKMLGIDPKKLPIVSGLPKEHRKRIIATYKLDILQKATNGNWIADYTDYNQYKYYPYFAVKNKGGSSSLVFSVSGYGSWDTPTGGGSRRCFKDRETAEWFGKKFVSLYKDELLFT